MPAPESGPRQIVVGNANSDRGMFETVALDAYCNSVAATYDGNRKAGLLNAWGNSLPAEELPFGATVTVAGTPFRLADKSGRGHDVVEPLGQAIELPRGAEVAALALLACGEMGEQYLEVRAVPAAGEPIDFTAVAKGFTVLPGDDLGPQALRCSHLHYPGDYDLGLMAGALWRCEHRFAVPVRLARLELGVNPLFRIAALTLIG